MTLQTLLDLIYQAMQVNFTVFGVSINLWSFFVFDVICCVVFWFIRNFFNGDDD